ncbi:MAG: hypothetical protein JWM31_1221 [Solirubrobacterales bacterium]|nr:hypothetical protein [Solirubrobacterales bacterium]
MADLRRSAFGFIVLLVCLAAEPAGAAPVYRSPGYAGRKIPATFVSAAPPRPVVLPTSGHGPRVLVDGAGTAHIAYADPAGAGDDVLRSCRLPRGGAGCAASVALVPRQPSGGGNDPQTNQDFQGPFPLESGNELLLVDARCCNEVPSASGFTRDPVYLYTSEDAGSSFTGPTDANPTAGLIGTQEPSGDAVLFGGEVPSIGLISSLQTGGTVFQGVPAGSFTTASANLSLRPNRDDANGARLGLDGTRPITAFSALEDTITVREWNGTGSVNDASQWTVLQIPGADQPRIAGGPKGVAMLSEPGILPGPLSVRGIAAGGGSAGAPQLLASGPVTAPTLSADPVSGAFVAAWLRTSDETVHVRTSTDGHTWTPDQIVMKVPGGDLGQLDAAVTADGGGFVVARDAAGAPTTFDGRILGAQFGPAAPTGNPGLGLVPPPGGSGPPSGDEKGFVACSQVHFGDVDVQATAGCFLRDPKNPSGGAAIAQSAVRLNGLDIVPESGVKIFLDPKGHTIDTSGAVQVIAQGAGSKPVILWHGPLHLKLPNASEGATLFDFDMGQFAASVEGFRINAHAKVILTKHGVRIPLDLQLPATFGGVTGRAELVVDQQSGLHLDSLRFAVDDVDIGVLELKDVAVAYDGGADSWSGGLTAVVSGPDLTLSGDIRFVAGAFNSAHLKVDKFPGVLVTTDVWLTEVQLGLQLQPLIFTGGVVFGFQPIAPPSSFAIAVDGGFTIQAGPPVVVQVTGNGSVFGIDLAHALFRYSGDGSLRLSADIVIGSKALGISGGLQFGFIGHDFGGTINAQACAFGVCPNVSVSANKRGAAVCLGPGSISHEWSASPFSVDQHWADCVADAYGPPAGTRAAGDGQSFVVPPAASSYAIAVDGVTGGPQLALTGPNGPVSFGDPRSPATNAVQLPGTPQSHRTFIGLRRPAAGRYTIAPVPGSSAVADMLVSRGYPAPKASAVVGGHGRLRTLRYRTSGITPGVTVRFVERSSGEDTVIADTARPSGVLRFRSAPGPGGTRQIVAQAVRDGLPWTSKVVASYRAPAITRPGLVRNVRLARVGSGLTIHFAPATNATSYVVKALLSDGRGVQRTLKAPKRSLSLPAVARTTSARVTITAVGADGHRITSRTVVLPAARRPHR